MAMEESDIRILLEIDGATLSCNKQDLIKNSDYFKAMFGGNFIENDQKIIKLQGIDIKAMTILLALVWDASFIIEEEDMLLVLQAACMLQFEKIKLLMIDKLTMILSIENCVKVWFFTEQLDLKPLYLKAKNLALIEFKEISRSDSVIELNLKQLHNYLSQTSLVCDCEMIVFNTVMRWWYENSSNKEQLTLPFGKPSNGTNVFLCLLACLDFSQLTADDLNEMSAYPDIKNDEKIVRILKCITDLKYDIDASCDDNSMWEAKKFLNCKPRVRHQVPLLLLQKIDDSSSGKRNKSEFNIAIYDKYKRKRRCTVLESISNNNLSLIYYDDQDLKKYIGIDNQKCDHLDGYKVIGYKEFLFLFGGEFLLGKGNWNTNFWVYDSIREKWERKCVFPVLRRHFQSCIVGNLLYVIGGTAKYRVLQDTMLSYNFKNDSWSKEVFLPCSGRQIKTCEFNNKLCVLDVNNRCGYIFSNLITNWQKLEICDSSGLTPTLPDRCSCFSYRNHLYIKGSALIKMAVIDQKLVIVDNILLNSSVQYDHLESLISGNVLYTLYSDNTDDLRLILEKFDMINKNVEYIFQCSSQEAASKFNDESNNYQILTNLTGFQHHDLVATNSFVTNLYEIGQK